MMILLKITAGLLLLSFLSVKNALGNTVTLSLSTQTAKTGDPLELTCLLNPTAGAVIAGVNWFLGSDTSGIQLDEATCNPIGPAPSYDLPRYNFTCSSSSNTFKMKIKALKSSDDGQCWTCSVTFSAHSETTKAKSACIQLQNNSLLLLLLLLLLILCIICCIIKICCGCLDCCKCCRIFGFYDKSNSCYVTWSCEKEPCCSFFCCRAEEKRGKCACCCTSGKEFCGGCHCCRSICTCGWPDCCTSDQMRSCGCCYCICCTMTEESSDGAGSTMVSLQVAPKGTQKEGNAKHTKEQTTSSQGGEDRSQIRPQPLPPIKSQPTSNYNRN